MNVNEVIEKAAALCRKYSAKEIILFGSRAKGTETERSDIDIAVSGVQDFGQLEEEIDALPTLYTVDLVNIDTCGNQLLKEDIEKYGRKYKKRYESFQKSLKVMKDNPDPILRDHRIRNQLSKRSPTGIFSRRLNFRRSLAGNAYDTKPTDT